MRETALYLDGVKFPINPTRLSFQTPTHSTKYELIETGEAELLQGARLAEIELEGVFPAFEGYGANDISPPSSYVENIQAAIEEARPVHLIYVGQTWDVNMLCSLQDPIFTEVGGSFDIEYVIKLRKWVEISAKKSNKSLTRKTASSSFDAAKASGGSYTVKQNDTLNHIAKCLLGDASRWREIYDLNKDSIKNPNLIYPGQKLALPDDASGTVSTRSASSSKRTATNSSSSSSKTTKTKSSNTSSTSSKNSGNRSSLPTMPTIPVQGVTNAKTNYKTAKDLFSQYSRMFS